MIPGKRLMDVAEQAAVIATANDTLERITRSVGRR